MSKKIRSQDSNFKELSITDQEDILDHYREAGEIDIELFGDYDAYECYRKQD